MFTTSDQTIDTPVGKMRIRTYDDGTIAIDSKDLPIMVLADLYNSEHKLHIKLIRRTS